MLTSDAKTMMFELYKEYKNRRSVGIPKADAKNFISATSVMENFFPSWCLSDVEDTMRELGRNGYLNNLYADNTIYCCSLSDDAIAKLENQPKETFLSVADFISKFIP